MTNVNDRLAAAADRAQGYAVKEKVQQAVRHEEMPEQKAAERTGTELKIKENVFYKTLTDPQATQEDKILLIADALDPANLDKAQAGFKAFQEYFTFVQAEELDEELDNIRRLIKELENNTKIEVAAILKKLKGMLDDVQESRKLVEVLRQSRVTGKTVEELTAAIERNDQVVADLAKLEERRRKGATDVAEAKSALESSIAQRDADAKKLVNRVVSVFRKDSAHDSQIAAADEVRMAKEVGLEEVDAKIAALTAERNKDLESGPLTILRSLDEADDNLSQRLINGGNKGIETINGAQKSALQLMQRALFSEGEIDKISRRVAEKQITLTIMKSGLAEASTRTNTRKEKIEVEANAAEDTFAAAKARGASVLEAAKAETAAITAKNQIGAVIDYQSRINDTLVEMNGAVAKNIERQGDTDRGKTIVQGTKKSITVLGRDTLNTVAGNIEGVLHNLVADQTDETQQAIVAFARAAEDVKKGSMESMMQRQHDMHDKDMELLDDTIKRLNASSEMIAKTLETSVDEGIARADKQRELQKAADELDRATTTMRTVTGKMSNESVQDRPAQDQNPR
jgi:hypothetical protein